MNRKLTFRTWDEQSKTMHIPMTLAEIFQIGKESELGFLGLKFKMTFDSLVFQQSTGLIDKYGIEIFEGDILKVDSRETSIGVVEYVQDAFKIRMVHFDVFWKLSTKGKRTTEVIGNIYQSSEVLKQLDQ